MDGRNRKAELLDAAMRVVAENGLSAFSMKRVTNLIGVSEALIYKHYDTKDNLLYTCFETVNKQIARIFDNMCLPEYSTTADFYNIARNFWMGYFDFLVKNDYRTLFYFEYRNSPYISLVRESGESARGSYFKNFADMAIELIGWLNIDRKVDYECLWTYILDTTGLFAQRVIRGELPDNEITRESAWRLISTGFVGIVNHPSIK